MLITRFGTLTGHNYDVVKKKNGDCYTKAGAPRFTFEEIHRPAQKGLD